MKDFEIDSEEVNAEEIMKKIRENIQKKGIDVYPKKCGEIQNDATIEEFNSNDIIKRDLEYINSNWNIQNNGYLISSHRPAVGKFLIKGRELVHGEVKRYVNPMMQKQILFNESTLNILNNVANNISFLGNKIKQIESNTVNILNNVADDISFLDNKIEQIESNIDLSEDKNLKINYFIFEEKFRGSRDEIKQRQFKYLDYFKDCKNVIDIGCGRGEFLELLKENSINAQGLDIDVNMIEFCQSKELRVNMMDAISFLEQVENNSLDGIFINQVVQHLEPGYLIKMLNLCYQKLMSDYFIIIETVNPLSFVSFVNFYIDLSHTRPLHPETMRFLLEIAGFREIELKFYSPIKDEFRLQKIQLHQEIEEREKLLIETFNNNIDILNNLLYGPQDYTFFGKK